MEYAIFYQLTLVLGLAAFIALVCRAFRQPPIIGYIATGFIVGPAFLNVITDHEAFASFSQIGIALLLFAIGLGLNAGAIRTTGKSVFAAFFAVILGVGAVSWITTSLLHLSAHESLVVALALLFSSTIVVIKALSDKKEQNRLYGQIAIGILLVEDIVATIALLFVSAQSGAGTTAEDFGLLFAKGGVTAAVLAFCGGFVLPRIVSKVAASQELLFICALAWAFGIAGTFHWLGFSIEVGALFAGVTLAHLPYAQEISTRLKPLRDFFLILFFVELGQNLNVDNLSGAIVPALLLSAIALIVKPLMIITSLGLLGYTKQTAFKTAVHLSQISEFSIILVVLAVNTSFVRPELASIITCTAIITIIVSSYLMKYDDVLYKKWQKQLSVFERGKTKQEIKALHGYPLVLLGYRNGGYEYVRTFREMKKKYVVIDYDPEVIEHLEHQHINRLYGDVTDLELLEEISLHKSEIVVSTITDITANLLLVKHLSNRNHKAIFICHARDYDDAVKLYEHGASFVIMPHIIGSEHANAFIRRNGNNPDAFEKYRAKHISALEAA